MYYFLMVNNFNCVNFSISNSADKFKEKTDFVSDVTSFSRAHTAQGQMILW
jgi:hypothetical protein